MTKAKDRWDRLIDKLPNDCEAGLWKQEVAKLLRQEHRSTVRIVKIEPEFPGHMPDEMWEAIRNDRAVAEEAMRIAVRKTKQNIFDQLSRRAT